MVVCRRRVRVVFTHGSVRFFKPFLPLDNLLFLPTAMFASLDGNKDWCGKGRVAEKEVSISLSPLCEFVCGKSRAQAKPRSLARAPLTF